MKEYLKSFMLLAIAIIVMPSCHEKNDAFSEQIQMEIALFTAILADEFVQVNIQQGNETRAFGFRSADDIPTGNSGKNENEASIDNSKLIPCLRQSNLTDAQISDIRLLMLGMTKCRMEASLSLREQMSEIIGKMERKRLELLEKVKKDEISREDFIKDVQKIREAYAGEIEDLRKKHVEMIKPCLKELVLELRQVLGQEKWTMLFACMKG
jgi:hypothetical protein